MVTLKAIFCYFFKRCFDCRRKLDYKNTQLNQVCNVCFDCFNGCTVDEIAYDIAYDIASLKQERFSIGTCIRTGNYDEWYCESVSYSTALHTLLSNGWTEDQANLALAQCPDKCIQVNKHTTIT
jgi:hypothetical protein